VAGALGDFSTVVSWSAFSAQLARIGVQLTPSALETIARRHGLPVHEGGVRGREVTITRQDVDAWLRFLYGVGLDTWIALLKSGAPLPRRVRRHRAAGPVAPLEAPRPLYVVTRTNRAHGEEPLRRASGALYASTTTTDVISRYVAEVADGIANALCWRYDHARMATASDLRAPTPSSRGGVERRASTLVGAFVRTKPRNKFAWINVSGDWFDLDPAVRTPVLLPPYLPRFQPLVDALRTEMPAAVFVAWSRRREISPMTFDSVHSNVDFERYLRE